MVRPLLPVLSLLAAVLPGQRPRNVEQALERFAAARDANEGTRRGPVQDLGRFTGAEVTTVLLDELQRAESASYRLAVVRALGRARRPEPAGVVAALAGVLQRADNPRICDEAAASLAAQGDDGVAVLARHLTADESGMHRTAACRGLERAEGDAARDLLVREIGRAAGRDRIAPLEALAPRGGDPVVDELRVRLAGDKYHVIAAIAVEQLARHDHPAAARLALGLSRRLPAKATAEHHAAVLHGLLRAVTKKHFAPILAHAARADAAFGRRTAALWTAALGEDAFFDFLRRDGVGHKGAGERRAVATALGLAPADRHGDAALALSALLTDRDDDVVRAATAALTRYDKKIALPPLLAVVEGGRDAGKAAAAHAVHSLLPDDGGWHGLLHGHATGKGTLLRATALRLLARSEGNDAQQALDAATKSIGHDAWQVRSAAIELLVALRDAAAVPLLVKRFDAERGRLRAEVAQALQDLTGRRFDDGRAWRAWWKQNAAGFTVAPAAKRDGGSRSRSGEPTTGATYWSLPVHSEAVIFVVDTSGSMRRPFGTGGTRLVEAKRQLTRVLEQMPPKAKVNIVGFDHDVRVWGEKLQSLSSRRRKAGAAFANALESRGGTDVHAGLRRAFADPEVDTVFLLTDGRPSAGAIIDADALAAEVARWNAGRGIRIHAVAIGESSRLLEQLARDSGGNYTVAR